MGKRKTAERVTIGDYTWEENKLSPHEEQWVLVGFPGVSVRITNYGPGDSEYRSGWRIVAGASEKTKYASRDAAMADAGEVVQREARYKLERASAQMREARQVAEAAGIIEKKETTQ